MFLFKRVYSLYSYLANLGIDPEHKEDQKDKRLMNILCMIWYHGSLMFLVSNRLLTPDLWYPTLQHFSISILVFGFVQYLNVKNYAGASKLLFLGGSLIQCIFFSVFIKPGELVELFTIFVPMAAVVLYDRFVLHLSALFISLAAALTSHFIFQEYLLPDTVSVVIALVFINSFLMLIYLKRLNQEKEALLAVERNKAVADRRTIEVQAEALQELNEFKNHFFVNISHEIRTPLALISGYAQKLAKAGDRRVSGHAAKMISDQSDNIKHLVDSIIDLSKLDANKLTLNKSEVNLSRLLQKMYLAFGEAFAQQHIQCQLSVPEEAVLIHCDKVLMARVLNNLLTNALKFTHPEGTVKISMRLHKELTVEVHNTGIGIPQADQGKIFERFYQADNDITRSQGSGIGLAMVKGILDVHGYRIRVESEPQQYASFVISIPVSEVVNDRAARTRPWLVDTAMPQPLSRDTALPLPLSDKKRRILLVEDNAAMRTYIASIDGLKEYTVLEASHGEEALAILSQHDIDLMITDYMMPHMNGLALVREAKQRGYHQPVLVITAQTDQQYKLEILRIGIDGYLTKPFLEEELLMMIRKSLDYGEARRQFVAEEERQGQVPFMNGEMTDFNQRLKEVIDQNISNDQFAIADLCEQLHLTERTLFRRVKELCGCTPAKLITESRLLKAKEHHDCKRYKSTRQLSLAVGFKNSTRFAEKFRARFGIEP